MVKHQNYNLKFSKRHLLKLLCFTEQNVFECVIIYDLLNKLKFLCHWELSARICEMLSHKQVSVGSQSGVQSQESVFHGGSPQGSVLGPLLFIVSMNELPFSVGYQSVSHADGTALVNDNSYFDDLHHTVNCTISIT